MITLRKTSLVLALASAAAISVSAPVQAQAIKGVGVVDEARVLRESTAARAADQQIQTQYAQNIQAIEQTKQQYSQRLEPLVNQFNAERAKPQPNQQVLGQIATQVSQINQEGEDRINQLSQPIALAQGFVGEQLSAKIRTVIGTVAGRRQATVVVSSSSTFFASPSVDLTSDVVAELNRDTSPIAVVPSQQWLQSKGLAQGGTAAPAATTPQPEGR